LKGEQNGVIDEPPVLIYVMGENDWRQEGEWPLARTQYKKLYLHSGGHANALQGDGMLDFQPPLEEPNDNFVYDPYHPVPTLGGGTTGSGLPALPAGVFDQRPNETREDVLVYTSQILESDMEMTGPVEAVLWISSSKADTDFTGKLVDVHTDGYARNLCDGILRVRFRKSFESPELMKPGAVYELHIDLVATSNLFKKGHRIRLEISSSNFPKFDRNPNTGRGAKGDVATAVQTVYHNLVQPSHLLVPIIPREGEE
jgi:putative CocE/NonD family hydrolase